MPFLINSPRRKPSQFYWTLVELVSNVDQNSINLPASARPGDVGMFIDMTQIANSEPPSVTPPGWTNVNIIAENWFQYNKLMSHYKRLQQSDIDNPNVPGMVLSGIGNRWSRKALAVYRPSSPISRILLRDADQASSTLGNPTTQTLQTDDPTALVICGYTCDTTDKEVVTWRVEEPPFENKIEWAEGAACMGTSIMKEGLISTYAPAQQYQGDLKTGGARTLLAGMMISAE